MAYNICIVDDQIPLGKNSYVDAGSRISSATLQTLLQDQEATWSESVVKELIEKLVTDDQNWSVSAFMSPEILISSMEREYYLPEFIIYDWDYGKTTAHSEELLKNILETSFSIVIIYTASDKKDTVQSIIDSDLKQFKNRIDLRIKTETKSLEILIEKIKEYDKTNFAFKFSKELRQLTHKTLESILIEFGKPDIKDITWLFGDEDELKNKKLYVKDLTEIIVEKLRSELIVKAFGSDLPTVDSSYTPSSSNELAKKMWAYRLYFLPKDNIVRKGDIIKKKNSNDNTLYLVISSDCHLKFFWKKNFGSLTLIPLHKIYKGNIDLIEKLELYKSKGDLKSSGFMPSSLVNLSGFAEGLTVIPFVPIAGGQSDFLLFPKEIYSQKISVPELKKTLKRKLSLVYDYLDEYERENRISISEPFITPLIEHILYNISGYGVPDYPSALQIDIANNFKGIFE